MSSVMRKSEMRRIARAKLPGSKLTGGTYRSHGKYIRVGKAPKWGGKINPKNVTVRDRYAGKVSRHSGRENVHKHGYGFDQSFKKKQGESDKPIFNKKQGNNSIDSSWNSTSTKNGFFSLKSWNKIGIGNTIEIDPKEANKGSYVLTISNGKKEEKFLVDIQRKDYSDYYYFGGLGLGLALLVSGFIFAYNKGWIDRIKKKKKE